MGVGGSPHPLVDRLEVALDHGNLLLELPPPPPPHQRQHARTRGRGRATEPRAHRWGGVVPADRTRRRIAKVSDQRVSVPAPVSRGCAEHLGDVSSQLLILVVALGDLQKGK